MIGLWAAGSDGLNNEPVERERLSRLLDDPSRTTREDVAELRTMAEQYPWFAGAQLLRAAGERAHGNVLADETVRAAAAHLPSRVVLHDLAERATAPPALRVVKTIEAPPAQVEADASPTQAIPPQALAAPEPLPSAQEVRLPKPPEPAPGPANDSSTTQAPLQAEVPLPSPPLPVRRPEPEAPPSRGSQPEPVIPEASAMEDELDAQIQRAALSSAFDLTYLEQLAAPEPTAPPIEPAPVQHPPESSRTVASTSRLRFTDWLDTAAQSAAAPGLGTPVASAPKANPAPAATVAATDAAPPPAAPAKLPASDLIDRFIRQQPPEIPPKPAFFTPQQAAKKSLDDTAGLVTETLARIYERQGNIAKAIDTYRRLALKYPEKSAYFAALSKALEEQQTP